MARTFHFFHLSLIEDLFSDNESHSSSGSNREKVIRGALSGNFEFGHRDKTLYWVPKVSNEKIIIGYIQKQTKHPHHYPPDQGGEEVIDSDWQGAIVVVDPTTHETGQRVAFEKDNHIGNPNAVLKSLCKRINQSHRYPFTIIAHPIFDETSFWSFVEQHDHRVKHISFNFAVPNMFGTDSNLEEELEKTRKDTKAETVNMTLSAENGVHTKESIIIKTAVDYAMKGGASVRARSKSGDEYDSNTKIRRERVDEKQSLNEDPIAFLRRIAKRLFRYE